MASTTEHVCTLAGCRKFQKPAADSRGGGKKDLRAKPKLRMTRDCMSEMKCFAHKRQCIVGWCFGAIGRIVEWRGPSDANLWQIGIIHAKINGCIYLIAPFQVPRVREVAAGALWALARPVQLSILWNCNMLQQELVFPQEFGRLVFDLEIERIHMTNTPKRFRSWKYWLICRRDNPELQSAIDRSGTIPNLKSKLNIYIYIRSLNIF